MTATPKLIDVYPQWYTTGGIFADMGGNVWGASLSATQLQNLDRTYYGQHSGNRLAGPSLCRLADMSTTPPIIDTSHRSVMAAMVVAMYGDKWTKLYQTLALSYDPIANYDMEETTTYNDLTDERTPDITRTVTDQSRTSTRSAEIYGFDSATAVPTGTESDVLTGYTTDAETGTDTNVRSGSVKVERSGNIGVTTTQQMIQQERTLWEWLFLEQVFRDLDSLLTLEIYDL